MAKIELVYRQIDERTRDVGLELAIENVRPDAVHVIDDVRPFTACVQQMLRIRHDCDYVLYLDADCLILEDMREFIEGCDAAYVDAYVTDQFRGRIHCGAHITRIDLVKRMATIEPPADDLKYVLRPESRLRNLAMKPLRMSKQFRNFDILHDHFQYYRHIFAKYALRELRSRTPIQARRLAMSMQGWPQPNCKIDDFSVARQAVAYARASVPASATAQDVQRFVEALPELAASELDRLGVEEKPPFIRADLDDWLDRNSERRIYGAGEKDKPKIFGLGLSRTGTRSLTKALKVLGYDCAHYPIDEDTYTELTNGQYDLTVLKYYDGLTDITVAPFFEQFDRQYPGSKFILTVRDRESWLRSCQNHWFNRPAFAEAEDPDEQTHYLMRQFLRSAVYGCYNFVPERFAWVYEQYTRRVLDYFKDRPGDLLVINVCEGEGYEKLAPFLNRPVPTQPFPHKGNVLSQRISQERAKIRARLEVAG